MPNQLDGLTLPAASASDKEDKEKKEEEKKCPKCGAVWKKKEPILAQVKKAIQDEICKFDGDLKKLDSTAKLGYRGSVANGTVGNPNKTHFGMEPDIRGECGNKFDVDGFILSDEISKKIKPDKTGKRWAARFAATRRLESQIRKALHSRSELAYLKPGKEGFELLVRRHNELDKLLQKGGVVILIF